MVKTIEMNLLAELPPLGGKRCRLLTREARKMNDRLRAIRILQQRGEPIEPNEWTDCLIKQVVKEIRTRRRQRINRILGEHNTNRKALVI